MPVIPILGAGLALSMGGASAIGAVLAGTATLATTLTAVAAVGATLGAVGAITHDKTLSMVGMVMGGIGGIGALAANAGLLGASATTESLFGSAADPIGGAAAHGLDAGLTASGESALQGAAAANENDIISSLGAMKIDAAMPNIDLGTGLSSVATGNAALPSVAAGDGAGSVSSEDAAFASGKGMINAPKVSSATDSGPGTGALPDVGKLAGPDTSTMRKGLFIGDTEKAPDGTALTWTKDGWAKADGFFHTLVSSPMGQLGMLQAGGSLIQGMFDPLKPAQVADYNSQAAQNRAAAALQNTQNTNMTQALPVASRVKAAVTGAPIGTGIINQAPTPAVPVTGVAA